MSSSPAHDAAPSGTDPSTGVHPLNPQQRAAIEHGAGPLMVLAGAGTGKTRVLVHRIARLVETGTAPWAILAVTFTNKAADEMCHRLCQILGDAAEAMWIGTFHAICARILRRFGAAVDLTRGFSIFDEADQVKIVERILDETGLGENLSPRVIMTRIDRAKNQGIDPAEPVGTPESKAIDDVMERIYPLYRDRLQRENAVDFNDLILRTLDLFDRQPAASLLADKFRHVLVDEFQDTNQVQYQLVRRFSGETRNLTVVGDDDQSIYAWRGAEPKNLLDFDQDFPDARVIKLEQNYRSTQTILDAANRVISQNLQRHDKALWTDHGHGMAIEEHRADDERGEAHFVARTIREILDDPASGASPGQCAVLYRTNAQSRVIEEYLHAARVPARVVGGVSFFERREVRDVVAYLRLILHQDADSSFERAVAQPARGIGEKTIERLRILARTGTVGMLEAARRAASGSGASGIGAAPRGRLGQFAQLIDGLRELAAVGTSAADMIVQVIERSGLRARLEEDKSEESNDRLDNLADLVTMAIDYTEEESARASRARDLAREAASARRVAESLAGRTTPEPIFRFPDPGSAVTEEPPGGDPTVASPDAPSVDPADPSRSGSPQEDDPDQRAATLEGFLERMVLSSPGDKKGDADAVVLTTIHVAKGLEWPFVFVTGLEDGLFPSLRARDEVSEESAIEEERRLAYVAITRARRLLVLSSARSRRIWGDVRIQEPSRFLDDAMGRRRR